MWNNFPSKFSRRSEIISGHGLGSATTCSSSSCQNWVNQIQHIIIMQCICERETTDFITVAVSAFEEKWYTQDVTGRSRLELHQEGECTFSYFSSLFDKKLWRVMLSLGGIYPIHTCSDIEKLFILLPNPCHVCIWRMKPAVTLMSSITLIGKQDFLGSKSSWFFVSIIICPDYVRKTIPIWEQFQAHSASGLCCLFVCLCWLAGTGVVLLWGFRPISFLIRHCVSRLEWNLEPVPS